MTLEVDAAFHELKEYVTNPPVPVAVDPEESLLKNFSP